MAVHLFAIVAREARRAVVFRRGPRKLVRLLAWDLENDEFVGGQWFKGRIYETRCDLSPDASKLIYFAANWKMPPWEPSELPPAGIDAMSQIMDEAGDIEELKQLFAKRRAENPELFAMPGVESKDGYYGSWTAVSRPPYLTALALWPNGDTWDGGGLFEDERTILLNQKSDLAKGSLPARFRALPIADAGGGVVYRTRLLRDGWQVSGSAFFKDRSQGDYQLLMNDEHGYRLLAGDDAVMTLPKTDWADWDKNGDLLFAEEGCLYRLCPDQGKDQARKLIDLRDQKFEEMPPPAWAQRWDG